MPHFDAVLFNKKAEKKILRLMLEEGDDILASVKNGMQQHKITECKVEDAGGKVKHAIINFMEGNKYKKMDLREIEILRASGNFKLNYGDLWGTMHISTSGKKPLTGTLVNGRAADGFELKLSFIKEVSEKN
jgi:predicted DNA-binding protein with PD1-like motif